MKVGKRLALILAAVMMFALLIGCTPAQTQSEGAGDAPASSGGSDSTSRPIITLVPPEFDPNESFSTGPNGEPASSATGLTLTDDEIQQLKDGNYKVVLAFHYMGNEFNTSVMEAISATFETFGIEIAGVTDANFSVEQQVADIESLLALNPDVLLSTPVDPVSTEAAFRKALGQGVKLVFMENIAANMTAGNEYVTCVAADNYGNGVVSADIMAQALENKGDVGIIFHDADFFVTRQRSDGFRDTINAKYPDINIVAEGGFTDQHKVTEVADGMFANFPNIDGVFTVWGEPAEGVIASAKSIDRTDLIITSIDLDQNSAKLIAEDGMIRGLGAQRPHDQGVALAYSTAYALLGKDVPAFITAPPLPVVKANLLEAFVEAYGKEPPQELVDILNNNK